MDISPLHTLLLVLALMAFATAGIALVVSFVRGGDTGKFIRNAVCTASMGVGLFMAGLFMLLEAGDKLGLLFLLVGAVFGCWALLHKWMTS